MASQKGVTPMMDLGCRSVQWGTLPDFQCVVLSIICANEDIVPRACNVRNRIEGAALCARVLTDEGRMAVFGEWEQVRVEIMPEMKKLELFFEHEGEKCKLEVMFVDILASFSCCLGGVESNTILLQNIHLFNNIGSPSKALEHVQFLIDLFHAQVCHGNSAHKVHTLARCLSRQWSTERRQVHLESSKDPCLRSGAKEDDPLPGQSRKCSLRRPPARLGSSRRAWLIVFLTMNSAKGQLMA
ncbi:hypothetical protein Cni_G20023 [Canna indica]|uniref:RDR1/2-like PH-like domain-containing protein n=1 Tax=Canna indica TaxID=4628 RepID=A0AAQ3KSG5_9LILI|nr:hypothetical protein Cni_G20023 [Canna indica]